MARTLAVVISLGLASVCATSAEAGQHDVPTRVDLLLARTTARVRSDNPFLTALIRDAASRSGTFRGLLEAIAATDGVVWVRHGRCGHGVHFCLPHQMAIAGPHRLLSVVVNSHKPRSAVIEGIAHELQHAIEVLSDPKVTSGPAMHSLFRRSGQWRGDAFETWAAILVGRTVTRELGKNRRLEPPMLPGPPSRVTDIDFPD